MIGVSIELGIALALLTVFAMCPSWVWRDAAIRGQHSLSIALVTTLTWPFGVLLWLVIRPRRIERTSAAPFFRFSIGSVLALTAAYALIFLSYSEICEYRIVAFVRISRELAVGDADFVALKDSVVRRMRSKAVLEQTVLEIEGAPNTAASDYLARSLSVTTDESELVKLRLDTTTPNGEAYLERIVDVYLRNEASAAYVELICPPHTKHRPPWHLDE